MTKSKFTPPTQFPAEYVDGNGSKVVIYGRGHGEHPLIGQTDTSPGAVKRWTMTWGGTLRSAEDGNYVRFTDYQALAAENEREDYDALQEVTAELEQAEARIEELELAVRYEADLAQMALDARKELEANLAMAVEALELALELAEGGLVDFSKHRLSCDADINERYRTTLAELSKERSDEKGQDDE